jgi:hypothetical protein
VIFLGPRANAELVPKFQVALHASHAALPMITLEISPYTNVTFTFDFAFGQGVFMGDMGEDSLLKLHGLSPRANYTDRATAACRRSDCQRLRIEGATWSA